VKCYYCDGGLCNWKNNDDPWVEHAHWFPDCHFVILNKGLSFVESCKNTVHQEGPIRSYPIAEDALAKKAVDSWMKSTIVVQLLDIHSYPADIVRTVLHKRWQDRQTFFEHFSELQTAVEEATSGYINLLVMHVLIKCYLFRMNEIPISDSEEKETKSSKASWISPSSPPLAFTSLSSSNGSYGDEMLCKICLDKKVGVLFLPCGHLVACTQCALGVTDCPICRKHIDGTVRTLFT